MLRYLQILQLENQWPLPRISVSFAVQALFAYYTEEHLIKLFTTQRKRRLAREKVLGSNQLADGWVYRAKLREVLL